ncbi:putative reverse transcriptase domain-containing protein [Tanacetum coccineum]
MASRAISYRELEDDDEEPEEDEADEDNDEEPEKDKADEDNNEEMEEEEDEEEEEIVTEDEAEIIYPYDEADPNNRPPPASDDESGLLLLLSSAREILKDIDEVYPLGLVPPTIGTPMRRIRKDLRIRMVGRDAMSLDGVVRECQADVSKVISMMESMSLEFDRVRKESRRALELVEWEAGVREQYLLKNAAMANDDVGDDDVEDDDDMDDDAADPSDPQSSEPRGSPRDSQIMPPKQMSQAAIAKLVADEVAKALVADRATRNTTSARGSSNVGGVGNAGGPERAQPAKDYTFSSFMKCGPTQFHGKKGAIELCHWFEKIECTFGISECIERNKVKFAVATLQVKSDIAAYTYRFKKLVLLCPDVVPSTKKKIGQYIKGLPSYIQGETYSSKPTTLNKAVRMAHGLMEHKIQGWNERNAEQNKRKWEGGNQGNNQDCPVTCRNCRKRGHKAKICHRGGVATGANTEPIKVCYKCRDPNHLANSDLCPERKKQGGRNASGHVYAMKDAEQAQGPNMVTGTFLLNNRYFSMLFDSGSDKSFINASVTHLFDIEPERISASYEVELADRRIVSTNTVLKGCTLNPVNHLFKIDLMPIELGTFDVIIGMDWLVALDAVIICGKKEVHIPVMNRTLVVNSDSHSSQLKVISCIKVRTYIERGCHLFLAHVTEKEKSEKRLEDVPVIHDFPEVFPDDLPGLPPSRQVEFKIDLMPSATSVARAPYRLAPTEMKELSEQLKELLEKGFIRPSSSPWGDPVLFVKKKDGSFRMYRLPRKEQADGQKPLSSLEN